MHKQPIYIKHNKLRKPQYSLRTEIIKRGEELFVRKVANVESEALLKNLLEEYDHLKKFKTDLRIIPAREIDNLTVEFPYIKGHSLLEKLSLAISEEEFDKEIKKYIEIVDSIPSSKRQLGKDFEGTFGRFNKEFKYQVLNMGILDITPENLIEDENSKIHLIDYEWTYNFPIPRDYIIYRALLYSSTNINAKMYIPLEKLIEKYINDKKIVEECKRWELNFQRKISKNTISANAIDVLENFGKSHRDNQIYDIKASINERNELISQNSSLRNDLEAIYSKNIIEDAKEYQSFKQTKIWKGLTIYRKVKRYSKNFLKNMLKDGPIVTFKRIFNKIKHTIEHRQQLDKEKNPYKYWLRKHEITLNKRSQIKKELGNLEYKPLISIIMPVYNVDVKWIKEAIKSIKKQIYTNWELCIADDASTDPKLISYLHRISKNPRIKVTFRKKNGHISEASNTALELAEGEYVALMDNDDIIHPQALAQVVKLLNEKPTTDFIYSDEDKIDMKGKRVEPFFKPDWSPDLFMSTNYMSHLSVIRKKLVDEVGGFRKGYEGSQDYDLFLRITEKTNNIEHIPDVLYSWRKIPGSTASEYSDKGYAKETTIKALTDALKRRKTDGNTYEGLFPGSFRVKYEIKGNPLISILIPTLDKYDYIERCISSLLEKTTYKNIEVLIIDTGSKDQKVLNYYKDLKQDSRIRILEWKGKFNYSGVNNFGVKNAKGEYIVLLNNDTEIISPNWIEGMLEHAQRKEVGAVGVKLFYPNNTIQHAGVILGVNGGTGRGVAGHAFKFFPREIQGFPVQKDIIKNYSAVTAACLMVSKKKYEEVKGLEEDFRIAFNDVDFCLKLLEKGYNNVYTPYVELYHHESISVGTPEAKTRDNDEFGKEIDLMYERWEDLINEDPFYNINLNKKKEDFNIT